ncbi:3126_t:CDS:2, partial [Racocetra persica]
EKYNTCLALSKLYEQYKGETKEISSKMREKELKEIKQELFLEFYKRNNYKEDSEKEFDQLLRQLLTPKVKIHSEASYHSKLLPTKEITQLLQNSQLIPQQNKSLELINRFLEKSKELTKELEAIIAANPSIKTRVQELTNLIKQKKEKIVGIFRRLLPDKEKEIELIQSLIVAHLEYTKAKNQSLPSKHYWEDSLEEEIEASLADCEKLVAWELELEEKLNAKQLLLENQKQMIHRINSTAPVQTTSLIQFRDSASSMYNSQQFIANQTQLITKQLVNIIEELTEESDKVFSTTEKPIFEEKDKIGEGGYSKVYRGKHKERDVAVKKLLLDDETKRKEIKNEINTLKKLKDRNIIQYYGVYYDNKEILIIMEHAKNGTLADFIKNIKEQNWKLNTNIIRQIASGLAYIHHKGIIHRDLKSLNVLMTAGNQTKIADFGLSIKDISALKSNSTGGKVATKCTTPFKDIKRIDDLQFHIIGGGKETIPDDAPQSIQNIIQQC